MITLFSSLILTMLSATTDAGPLTLTEATIVTRGANALRAEQTAAIVLAEEVEKRTETHWKSRTELPDSGPAVVLCVKSDVNSRKTAPANIVEAVSQLKKEGFVLAVDASRAERPVVWVVGADARGVLFGVGKLLRTMELTKGSATLSLTHNLSSAPAYPIRGHQLGYRQHSNTYDAWDVKKYEQYIRDMAIFGANSVEGIPFQDDRASPLMPIPRKEMNVRISEICDRYDQDYWIWTPATFDLKDAAKRADALKEHEELYKACPRLDAIFFPGGDPGNNPPQLVLPFLSDLSKLLLKYHPKAKIWLSLQGFHGPEAEYVYKYLDDKKPDWIGGIVCGPGSPAIPATRKRLNAKYPIRAYPDVTHNVRCQYPIPWWDPALAFTLGREAINPRPVQYTAIHNATAPDTVGFISYSDGAHDDVNKVLWSSLAWNSNTPARAVLVDYCRYFFGADVAEDAADGILALEKNWTGSLRDNEGVGATLALWRELEYKAPRLAGDWRWQMCLVRAFYDAYTRARLIHETALEGAAMAKLAEAPRVGSQPAMDEAAAVLKRAETEPVRPEYRKKIEDLCDALFKSIRLQASVPKYQGSDPQRGCFLDFIDRPLNDRWWLEDEFVAIAKLPSEKEKQKRLDVLRTWEHPGSGSYYDQVGDRSRAPHVVVGDLTNVGEGLPSATPIPEVLWWDKGFSRKKLAWMVVMNWPEAMKYDDLDPKADYVIRTTGYGTCLLSVDDEPVKPTLDGKGIGEFKEFPVPRRLYQDGSLTLTFERPNENVNWRYQSRLCEIWLLKQ